jgi:hypothetical protein
MPGRASESTSLRLIGAVAAVVGLVGYVVLGWRFDGTSGAVPTGLAVLAVAIALGATVYRRVSD